MASDADRAHVRLAALVASLSLGIDLGFGQPMEHVLRQCLIALRLGERIGLDEDARATVCYTALPLGVGCHTDAHEQAKWFGDDIALKASKYEHGLGLRGAVEGMRRIGAGHPALHRFRVGLEFALSGHGEVDVREDRRLEPGDREPLRDAARAAPRGGVHDGRRGLKRGPGSRSTQRGRRVSRPPGR